MKSVCPPASFRAASAWAAALLCLAIAVAGPAKAQRLPTTVIPEHYTLLLTPDLKAATFTGVETIEVTLAEPSKAITLNSAEIEFQSVAISSGGNQQTATVTSDKEKEQTTFTVADQIPAGKATLSIAYTGILNNQLRGFYLSKTAKRNYAVTQFESTDARRAYPSFDEPAFKATYDISLVIDAGDTAISNGPIVSDTPGPGEGKHTVKFLTTPKMSTYLVAFLVGDFKCTEGEADGVKIRGCATPDKVDLTPYSVEVAKYILHYYDTYFGIPYPLKKLDLIGLPDFEAGAMENFGAITYRETDMLIDAKTASVGAKKNVALVVAHEMAHQWFGDLVTMQWWDNIWLNEGRWRPCIPSGTSTSLWPATRTARWGWMRSQRRTPSAPRQTRAKRSSRCSMASPTARPAMCCWLWRIISVPRHSARACTRISRHTYTRTPQPRTFGERKPQPATSLSTRSWSRW
jgi:aminopeptidase N/puromycin-sensitive aminopeptidase